MVSTTTINAVSGGITNNTPDVSANPAESKNSLAINISLKLILILILLFLLIFFKLIIYSPDPENVASTSSSIPLTPSSSDSTVLTTSNSIDGKLKMIHTHTYENIQKQQR